MGSGSYPFIDLAVLDGLRERLCAGEPVVLLDSTLDTVLLANGGGAQLLGFSSPFDLVGNDPELGISARRQINSLALINETGLTGSLALRLVSGVESRMAMVRLVSITLPDGEMGIVLSSAIENATILSAIDGLAGEGTHTAILDGEGALLSASEQFEQLGLSEFDLATLARDTARESDRMVKRRLRVGARTIPVGVGRLSDDPARFIMLAIADLEQAQVGEPALAKPAIEIIAKESAADVAPDVVAGQQTTDANVTATIHSSASEPEQDDPFAPDFAYDPESAPTRFVWKIDADGYFSFVSPEFAEAVGPHAADVVGRSFREVSKVFGLDPAGEITDLLERHDTWSGRSVFWPIEGTDLRAPVDLAALPVYSREDGARRFEGFRGFGIVRLADAVIDPESIGLALARPIIAGSGQDAALIDGELETVTPLQDALSATEQSDVQHITVIHDVIDDIDDEFESDPWQGEVPALEIVKPVTAATIDDENVIRLESHRAARNSGPVPSEAGALSPVERNAFREIAERLRRDGLITPEPTLPSEDELPPVETVLAAPDTSEFNIEADVHTDREIDTDSADLDYDNDETELEDLARLDGVSADEIAAAAIEELVSDEDDLSASVPFGTEIDDADDEEYSSDIHDAVETAVSHRPHSNPVEEAPILSRLPIPILIHDGTDLLFANQAFFDLTGYRSLESLQEVGGIEHLFRPGADDSETPGASNSVLRTAYETDVPVRAHLHTVAWKGGSALLLSMRQVEPKGTLETTGEMTELRQEVAELSSVLETATDGVIFVNNDNTIRDINQSAEALFGFDPAIVVGKPFTQLFAVESQRIASDYLASLSSTGVASLMNDGREVIGREAHGRFIPLFMTIGRLAGANGYCAVLRDITQWKRAEEELNAARRAAEHASTQKSEFLARVSHEIRTPLNAIIGFSDLMTEERFGPVGNLRYLDYLKDINRSGRHVLDLVNDLLDISKIEAGQQEMDFESVALNEALSEAVSMMQPQANRERVIIRSSFASELPDVVADLRSVKQIALNLLSNAVRYTGAGGQVIISTSYELTGGVIIRVRDTGVGMSAQEIDQAMKPFKQINALRRERGDGTGLGLPLTKAMVEANRAAFVISSTPGQGTLVEITFPSTRVLAD